MQSIAAKLDLSCKYVAVRGGAWGALTCVYNRSRVLCIVFSFRLPYGFMLVINTNTLAWESYK